jgi:hypothetical protein
MLFRSGSLWGQPLGPTSAAGGIGPPPSHAHQTASPHWAGAKGTEMTLTGQYQFRKTFAGKVVLQVEEEAPTFWSWFGKHRTKKRWRDATLMDLSAPALRILLDWRFKPPSLTRVDVERTSGSAARPMRLA